MPATTTPPRTSKLTGRYLYAVIASAGDEQLGPFGVDDSMVYAIPHGDLSAIVSDLPNDKLRPERRRLAAHHDVLKRLLARGTVLPMAFGIIADGVASIERILTRNRKAFVSQLAKLDGKVEMGLRVAWDVPNIFDYFVTTHPDLRALRDRMFWNGREPTRDDRIELGRQFDRTLTSERELQTEKAVEALKSHCTEIKENKPRNEREVMNLACLIPRAAAKDFEQGVFATAAHFDNNYTFDFNGPWPAHNFVEVELET